MTSDGATADRSGLRVLPYAELWAEGLARMVRAEDRFGSTEPAIALLDPGYRRAMREVLRREQLPISQFQNGGI